MNARDVAVHDGDFFGVVGRMLGAMFVAFEPVGVHAQGDVGGMASNASHDVAGEKNVRVTANEAIGHQVFGMHEGEQDVVVLPVRVVAKGELRIIALAPSRSGSRR